MMTWRQCLIGWGIVAGALVGCPRLARAGDDFQSWHTVEVSKRLGASCELFCAPEGRLRDDATELFYHESRQGVRWSPSQRWTLGLNYLFARSTNTAGKHRDEHTAELDITPKATWGPIQVSARGRLALRTIEGSAGEQEVQLRLMPKAAYPMRLCGRRLTPYLADDAFYDYSRDAWIQNRWYLGVSFPLTKTPRWEMAVDLYYMLQHQLGSRRGDWSSQHVLGSKWSVKF